MLQLTFVLGWVGGTLKLRRFAAAIVIKRVRALTERASFTLHKYLLGASLHKYLLGASLPS